MLTVLTNVFIQVYELNLEHDLKL